ncbi:hypothetical protein K435DRAFT_851085 [Dendrothele bispora CBS 962.96]|uniref:Major facilitator superfamily (MFS) profile domain-containing protein n=1 Tax=Dendrothele bispora (strain CBS 962.96) TaxID=1314807 RepID=A0A4S8MPP7_DENBC|nr:hypothetical protein K435DRAFT_851085 [Dendrothele bispora CBS 962.96]
MSQQCLPTRSSKVHHACEFDLGSRFHPSTCCRPRRRPSHLQYLCRYLQYRRTHLPIRNHCPTIPGRMIPLQKWSVTCAILIRYFIQFGCSFINGKASSHIPRGLQMLPAIVFFCGMRFPESPRWLLGRKRDDETLTILADLHGGGDKNNELMRLEFGKIKEEVRCEVFSSSFPLR